MFIITRNFQADIFTPVAGTPMRVTTGTVHSTVTYPEVLSESETLDLVLAGKSVARYGDGEFKICRGRSIKSQSFHPGLRERLRQILHQSGDCLVGIPNIHSATPKASFWCKYTTTVPHLLSKRPYVSAFMTRPDSAPWIDCPDYWTKVEALWKGRDVTLVRGTTKSFTAEVLASANSVTEVIASPQHAWVDYEELLERIGTPVRALICLGPTATVMAVDLCAKGVHAIDAGHCGFFWKERRHGATTARPR